MQYTPFHAYYKTKKLTLENKLLPVFVSSSINIYPYQIAAASFALDVSINRGVILADEGSLGKTYEALLIISQKWFEGATKILIVVPVHLLAQWVSILEDKFSIPFFLEHNEYTDEVGIFITSYENSIPPCKWDIVCFDEAQRLRKDNDTNNRLKSAVEESYKILLTPAPIMNDIMDLYYLINLIDKDEFPDQDEYYNRYFRQENFYPELAERAGKYVFRTLRSQASSYVNIPNRLVASVTITPTDKELELHNKIVSYANKNFKKAYPKMNNYDLMLLLTSRLSSSTFAFSKTMKDLLNRIENDAIDDWERKELSELLTLSESFHKNTKIQTLLEILPKLFHLLTACKGNKKVLIFVKSRITLKILDELIGKKYKTVSFDGSKSRHYEIIEKFRKEAQVLIATDIANEGLNLEFCSCVINFDTSYNTLDIEQRILRCHRQNQLNDVLVVNFINNQNASDTRALELYKKRLRQFAGIFGISDDILGCFCNVQGAIEYFSQNARDRETIQQAFEDNLKRNESDNTVKIQKSKSVLFSTFDEEISYSSTLTPEYVETKKREMNDDLWYITAALMEGQSGLSLNHKTRTIKAYNWHNASHLFKDLYIRRDEYSMTDTKLPKSGQYTLTSKLALHVLRHLISKKTAEGGDIYIEKTADLTEPCFIECYDITVKKGEFDWNSTTYDFMELMGKTESGVLLKELDCKRILSLPVVQFNETGKKPTWQERRTTYTYPTGDLQNLINTQKYRDIAIKGAELVEKEILRRLKRTEFNKKAEIKKRLQTLTDKKKAIQKEESSITSSFDRIKLDKKLAVIEDDLKQAESMLFMEKMRIEYETEQQMKKLLEDNKISVDIKRIFKINVRRMD